MEVIVLEEERKKYLQLISALWSILTMEHSLNTTLAAAILKGFGVTQEDWDDFWEYKDSLDETKNPYFTMKPTQLQCGGVFK